jgi:hypothetical protein
MTVALILALVARLGGSADSATCYALHTEPWGWPSFSWRVPAVVRLGVDTARPGGGRLTPDLESLGARRAPPMRGYPKWERVANGAGVDSVVLTWSDGYTGVRLRAAVSSETLYGEAESFTDVVGWGAPHAKAAVTGRRMACRAARAG